MSDLLILKAQSLGGVFAWKDARALGLRARDLTRLASSGEVEKVGPRAYVLAQAMAEADTSEKLHRLSTLAVLRSFDECVAASHHSAAALYGLPFWRVDRDTVHLARVTGKATRRREGLVVHEAYPDGALESSAATRMKSVNVALAVIGTAMLDGEEAGIVMADHALHHGRVAPAEFQAWLARLARHPGVETARRAIAQAEPLTESVGETRTRLILHAMPDLPQVVPQVPFFDAAGNVWARGDFGIGPRLVLEFDGRKKYRAAEGSTAREIEEIVWAEKQREDRIRSRERRVVRRVIWADLDRPRQVQAAVRDGLREVEELYGGAAA